jgi:hypothetical protein
MHNVDEILDDLDLNISARVRASHWLNPVNPSAYRCVTPTLVKRLTSLPVQRHHADPVESGQMERA